MIGRWIDEREMSTFFLSTFVATGPLRVKRFLFTDLHRNRLTWVEVAHPKLHAEIVHTSAGSAYSFSSRRTMAEEEEFEVCAWATAAATPGPLAARHDLTTIFERPLHDRSNAYHLGIRFPGAPRLRIDLGGGGQ